MVISFFIYNLLLWSAFQVIISYWLFWRYKTLKAGAAQNGLLIKYPFINLVTDLADWLLVLAPTLLAPVQLRPVIFRFWMVQNSLFDSDLDLSACTVTVYAGDELGVGAQSEEEPVKKRLNVDHFYNPPPPRVIYWPTHLIWCTSFTLCDFRRPTYHGKISWDQPLTFGMLFSLCVHPHANQNTLQSCP